MQGLNRRQDRQEYECRLLAYLDLGVNPACAKMVCVRPTI